jgi:hypothetical protein
MPPRATTVRAVPAKGKKHRKRSKAKGGSLLFIIGCILFVAALPLCLVVAAGMAPTIVANIIDREPKRFLLRTIAVLNLAGMIVPIATLFHYGLTIIGAAEVLLDPYKWLWMYGAAAAGWLCYLGTPPLARSYVESRAVKLERDLKKRAQDLVDEWGEEVGSKEP